MVALNVFEYDYRYFFCLFGLCFIFSTGYCLKFLHCYPFFFFFFLLVLLYCNSPVPFSSFPSPKQVTPPSVEKNIRGNGVLLCFFFFLEARGWMTVEGGVSLKPFVRWERPCQRPVRKGASVIWLLQKIKDARGRAKSLWLIRTVIHSPCHIVCPLSRWPVRIKHAKGGEE